MPWWASLRVEVLPVELLTLVAYALYARTGRAHVHRYLAQISCEACELGRTQELVGAVRIGGAGGEVLAGVGRAHVDAELAVETLVAGGIDADIAVGGIVVALGIVEAGQEGTRWTRGRAREADGAAAEEAVGKLRAEAGMR